MNFRSELNCRIFFRVDLGPIVGYGHYSRCLTLARHLLSSGDNKALLSSGDNKTLLSSGDHNDLIHFIGRGYQYLTIKNKMIKYHSLDYQNVMTYDTNTWIDFDHDIKQFKFIVKALGLSKKTRIRCLSKIFERPKKPTILIIDHYGIDFEWQKRISGYFDYVIMIDDLANRFHHVDMLIDYTPYHDDPYDKLVNDNCMILIGGKYLITDPIISQYRRFKNINNKGKLRFMVSFGGNDLHGQTMLVVTNLIKFFIKRKKYVKIEIDIVVGLLFDQTLLEVMKKQISKLIDDRFEIIYSRDITNREMLSKMCDADIGIGAPGLSSYERCVIGLPSIVITIADNQLSNVKHLSSNGLIRSIGKYDEWTPLIFEKTLSDLMSDNFSQCHQINQLCLQSFKPNGCDNIKDQIVSMLGLNLLPSKY